MAPVAVSGRGAIKRHLLDDEQYLLTCMRYIELNPVRANMVTNSVHYRWSSYRCNALGNDDKLITYHELYQWLGRKVKERCDAYKGLFRAHVDEEDLQGIRSALQTGTPLGGDYFKEKIEKKLNMKVGQSRCGRPDGPLKAL